MAQGPLVVCRPEFYCTPRIFVFNWVIYQHLQNGRVHIKKSRISGLGKMEDMRVLVPHFHKAWPHQIGLSPMQALSSSIYITCQAPKGI